MTTSRFWSTYGRLVLAVGGWGLATGLAKDHKRLPQLQLASIPLQPICWSVVERRNFSIRDTPSIARA